MAELLNGTDRKAALAKIDGWLVSTDQKAITKSYKFKDFTEAFGFMTRAALVCDTLDHHPDWRNVYNKVDVELSTHDAGGITVLDIELATAMDTIVGGMRNT